jgi:hypothetical protein
MAESLREIHAAQQVSETRITAPRVVRGMYLETNDRVGMLRVSFLQEGQHPGPPGSCPRRRSEACMSAAAPAHAERSVPTSRARVELAQSGPSVRKHTPSSRTSRVNRREGGCARLHPSLELAFFDIDRGDHLWHGQSGAPGRARRGTGRWRGRIATRSRVLRRDRWQ